MVNGLRLLWKSARGRLLGLALAGLLALGARLGCTPAGPAEPTGATGATGAVGPTGRAERATAGGAVAAAEAGRVVRVVDGDTYDVLAGGRVWRVRLLGVDAPERDQAFGRVAADSVGRVLRPGRAVWLTRRGVDLYGRTLGTVRVPTGSGRVLALDSLLVVRGWAWAWEPGQRVAGRAAQQAGALAARLPQRGLLWKCGAAQAVPPQQWRQFDNENKRRYGVGCTW